MRSLGSISAYKCLFTSTSRVVVTQVCLLDKSIDTYRQFSTLKQRYTEALRIPPGTLDFRVKYVTDMIPVGQLQKGEVKFCRSSMNKCLEQGQIEMARKILDRLVQEAKRGPLELKPSDYNRILRGIGRYQKIQAFRDAKELLESMIRESKLSKNFPEPDQYTYRAFTFVCAVSNDPKSLEYADNMVRTLEAQKSTALDTGVYNNIILAHANQAGLVYGEANQAEDWLLHLSSLALKDGPNPDTQSFNYVIKAWSIAEEFKGADRALEILELMIKLAKGHEEVGPDSVSFSTVITAFGRRGRLEDAQKMYLRARKYFEASSNAVDYSNCLNAVVSALCTQKDIQNIKLGIQWVREAMRHDAARASSARCLPCRITSTCIIDACSSIGGTEAIDAALDYLESIQGQKIANSVDSTVLSKFARAVSSITCAKREGRARAFIGDLTRSSQG